MKDRRSAADIASTRSTSTGGLYTVEARNYRQIYLAAFLKAADGMVFHGDREPLDRGVR
jgi:hypothetical protein